MHRVPNLVCATALFFLWFWPAASGFAQETLTVRALSADDASVESAPKKDLQAGWRTEKEARTLTLSIPAPRGQIVDRNGVPLAQTRVAQYLALNFPYLGATATDAEIVSYARSRMGQANEALRKAWSLPEERLLAHYKNRRWLPLVFSISDGINEELASEQIARIKPLLRAGGGLMLQPAYLRYYPKGACAPHIIGYTGKVRPLPLTPVQDGDPIFEESEGRGGLEKSFDKDLQGRPGLVNMLFNPDGSKADEQILRRPLPGNNVVTTLDYTFQKYTENALAKSVKGGAMVIMEVRTGDILSLASYPLYDPNLWIPGITSFNFARLKNDPGAPMNPRADQGLYPPASTFKIIVAQAALETGKITPRTAFNCDASFWVGDREFHNWSKQPEGSINVITAIKRSCNTWFYQAALEVGAQPITDMAQRFGFGERTGIPLEGEPTGFVPTDTWIMERFGHKMQGGDIANLSIGQGRTLVSPLQVAQAMCAIADGTNMPAARLVKQIQDSNDRVLQAFPSTIRRRIDLQPEARATVIKGMIAVVNGERGTGHSAQLDEDIKIQVAGKTGTAQWSPGDGTLRHLAWFTGFLPANDPIYAYAVVYEGQPGEEVSGGRLAAPIVSEVFNNVYKNASPEDPLVLIAKAENTPKAIAVTEDDEKTDGDAAAQPQAAEGQPLMGEPQPEPENRGFRGFFRRIFGR
ncbi:MAG: penicillin-binding transpeptidase domain-containing protein [Roseimicrobium sp.]